MRTGTHGCFLSTHLHEGARPPALHRFRSWNDIDLGCLGSLLHPPGYNQQLGGGEAITKERSVLQSGVASRRRAKHSFPQHTILWCIKTDIWNPFSLWAPLPPRALCSQLCQVPLPQTPSFYSPLPGSRLQPEGVAAALSFQVLQGKTAPRRDVQFLEQNCGVCYSADTHSAGSFPGNCISAERLGGDRHNPSTSEAASGIFNATESRRVGSQGTGCSLPKEQCVGGVALCQTGPDGRGGQWYAAERLSEEYTNQQGYGGKHSHICYVLQGDGVRDNRRCLCKNHQAY